MERNYLIIDDILKSKGLSRKWLEDQVSLSRQTLSRIINQGKTKRDTLEKIANALEVPVHDLEDPSREWGAVTEQTIRDLQEKNKENLILIEELKNEKKVLIEQVTRLGQYVDELRGELKDCQGEPPKSKAG